MPQTVPVTFTSYAGMDIGKDYGLVVDRAYEDKAPYAFTGTVKQVVFDLNPVAGGGEARPRAGPPSPRADAGGRRGRRGLTAAHSVCECARPGQGPSMDESRIAMNEATFRRVNEAIQAGRPRPGDAVDLICECGRLGCVEHLRISADAYRAVRADRRRFVVVPGHELPEVEDVVARATGTSWSRRRARPHGSSSGCRASRFPSSGSGRRRARAFRAGAMPGRPCVPPPPDRSDRDGREAEARAVPRRGAGQRARPGPRAPGADRHDPARALPDGARDGTSRRPATTPSASAQRRSELGGSNPVGATVALAEAAVAQTLALGRTPLEPDPRDRRRGEGAEERQGRLRDRGAGDRHLHRDRAAGPSRSATGRPRGSPRRSARDEERMLERILRRDPAADRQGRRRGDRGRARRYDVTTTGAADAAPGRRHDGDATAARADGDTPAPRARRARPRASRAPRARSRAPSRPRTISRSRSTTASPPTRSRRASRRSRRSTWRRSTPTSGADREARDDPEPHRRAARRRAVARLRRAERRRDPVGV